DNALQGTRSVIRVVSCSHKMNLGRVGKVDSYVPVFETPSQIFELDLDNLFQMIFRKSMEDDDLVHSIEELRSEMISHLVQDGFLHTVVADAFESSSIFENPNASDIGGHDDDGVFEIHSPTLSIGQPAVIQNLQQYVEDVTVRFLDFIKQNY